MNMSENSAKGAFVLSLDFELMWGMRDGWSTEDYGANILGVRDVVPRLLSMFERYRLSCTWATVGFLFFDDKDDLLSSLPDIIPEYNDASLSPYPYLKDIGPNEREDPYHFGLSLIGQISEAPRQEIGTHTFSHYYCREPGQTPEAFRADLKTAIVVAKRRGIELKSIVFPRNQYDAASLAICREVGLCAYRGNEKAFMYRSGSGGNDTTLRRAARLSDAYINLSGHNTRPLSCDGSIVNVPSSRFLRPWTARFHILEQLRINRIIDAMRHAASKGQLFHLWFHPHNFGINQDENFAVLERILIEMSALRDRYGWPSLTMAEAAGVASTPAEIGHGTAA